MYNSEAGKRKMALAITHYAYRNTFLEDYHSESKRLDMNFYNELYSIVDEKLRNVLLFHKYIEGYPKEQINKADIEDLTATVPEELRVKFLEYLLDILFHSNFGSDWDTAEILECNLNGECITDFVLSGHFLECCKNGEILSDKIMCYINKDVHNRIYTLLLKDYFS
ncbi:MAG: hypothetical protein K2J85_06705 [Anaeroplasmataceae bacterium]|nr:hypothetical protein [Anaeroplasmataceae bacterium]